MLKPDELGNEARDRLGAFLSDKPLWAYLVVYVLLAGAIFGFIFAVMYFLVLRWWGAVITVIAIGGIWGSSAYRLRNGNGAKKR